MKSPVVSIIVPARNEEASLGACLDSLVAQTGIDFEIIVVDDASSDRTAEIARSFATDHAGAAVQNRADASPNREGTTCSRAEKGAFSTLRDDSLANHPAAVEQRERGALPNFASVAHRRPGEDVRSSTRNGEAGVPAPPHLAVVSAPPLPENWTGKNNAMSAGAKIAKGNWLLFTDADTVHKPGSLSRAVAEAEQHGAALLSYSPEQEVRTFWEKAVMPVIFAELAAAYPPKKVSDPASPIAAANGQYLLISRDAYDAVGGHSKIAADLLEDVAMARLVKSSSRKIFFRYGGDAVRTRMYRSWSQMNEGWTKNLALLFAKPTELARVRIWQFVFVLVLPWSILRGGYWKTFLNTSNFVLVRWNSLVLGIAACTVFAWSAITYFVRMRKAHCGWANLALGILGLPVFGYLLLSSHRAYKNARFDWKDRSYIYSKDEIRKLTQAS